jgi:glycosyltransferase involved in cell wall biosynthesis
MSTISVIVATKNRLADLAACLQAITRLQLAHRGGHQIEVCVVNDGGASIRQVVEAYPGVQLAWVDLPMSVGQVAARNHGIEMASGDWIAFCDDDDRLLPEHVDRLLTATDDAAAGWAHADAEIVEVRGAPGNWRSVRRQTFAFQVVPSLIRKTNPIVPSSLLISRRLLIGTGGLDVQAGHYWDWDLVLRLTADHIPAQSRCCSVLYGVSPDRPSMSHNPQDMRPDLIRLIDKHALGELPSLNFERMLSSAELAPYRRHSTRLWNGDDSMWNGQH